MRYITYSGIAATNALARTKIAAIGDVPRQGHLGKLIFHVTAIAGGATKFSKITLGHVDHDRRYYLPKTSGTWDVDAGVATNASLVLDIDKAFVINDTQFADTANYAGWYLGLQLDAGTATVEINLVVEE